MLPRTHHLFRKAIRIKKLAQQGEFDYDAVYNIMNEEKKSELDTVTIKNETLRKYFPRNYTPRQMESIIIKLLDQWQLKSNRQNRRSRKKRVDRRLNQKDPVPGLLIFCKNFGGNAYELYYHSHSFRESHR